MFGTKIIEFDNSDGTVESFNRIFPNTPIDATGYVEILGITEDNRGNLYLRDIVVNGKIVSYDFGESNFVTSFAMENNHRFRYLAKDLSGNTIAKAYSMKDLAEILNCSESIVKNRSVSPIKEGFQGKYLFNVEQEEV